MNLICRSFAEGICGRLRLRGESHGTSFQTCATAYYIDDKTMEDVMKIKKQADEGNKK